MTDAEIRAALKTLLESVPGSGMVHDYERFATDSAGFLALFRDGTGKIFGWEITRTAIARPEKSAGKYRFTADYRAKGYYGLQDSVATEKAFNLILDAILAKLLGKKIAGVQGYLAAGAENIGTRVFGNVLCHYAEISIPGITWYMTPEELEEETDLLGVDIYYELKPGDNLADAEDEITLEAP